MTRKVRLLKPWGLHAKGAVIDPPVPVAAELIRSGRAEAVPEPEAPKAKQTQKGTRTK